MRTCEHCVSDKSYRSSTGFSEPGTQAYTLIGESVAFRKRAFLVNFHITSEAVEDLRVWTLNLVMEY